MALQLSENHQHDFFAPAIDSKRIDEIEQSIRQEYWFVRRLRGGKHTQAEMRRRYRAVEKLKDELEIAGVPHRDILDFISCCRLQCVARKQPFLYCPHCSGNRE